MPTEMFWSAASLALPLLALGGGDWDDVLGAGQLAPRELQVWQAVQPSIMVIRQGGVSRGSAACIDSSGLFLAHQNSVHDGPIEGVTADGEPYTLRLVARDKPTGLILLQVDGGQAPHCPVVRIADENHARQGTLLAVLSTGPVRADIGQPNIVGTSAATNQSVLLNEIRFAAPPQLLTGALLFDDRGNLVGVLGATLPKATAKPLDTIKFPINNAGAALGPSQPNPAQPIGVGRGGSGGVAGGFGGGGLGVGGFKLGPADLNVAYAVSPMLLDRVVTGFLSPTHEVLHPALGAVCADVLINGVSQGVVIRRIARGSGADKAGLRVGDIILNIEGTEINNVTDYARVMLAQDVGHRITIAIRRGSLSLPVEAVVGRITDPAQLEQQVTQSAK